MAGDSCSGDDIIPDRRNGGCGALIDNKLYFWGGETEDTVTLSNSDDDDDDDNDDSEEEEGEEERMKSISVPVNLPRPPDHPFDVLDIHTLMWTRQPTKGLKHGDVPAVGIGSTLTYHPGTHSLYLYAGWNDGNFDSEVYKVAIDEWMWKKLKQVTSVKPSPRYLTAVVLHGDRLCMFGGVGPEIVRDQDPGAQYFNYIAHGKTYTFGWNNEYYEFDVNTSEFNSGTIELKKKAYTTSYQYTTERNLFRFKLKPCMGTYWLCKVTVGPYGVFLVHDLKNCLF